MPPFTHSPQDIPVFTFCSEMDLTGTFKITECAPMVSLHTWSTRYIYLILWDRSYRDLQNNWVCTHGPPFTHGPQDIFTLSSETDFTWTFKITERVPMVSLHTWSTRYIYLILWDRSYRDLQNNWVCTHGLPSHMVHKIYLPYPVRWILQGLSR